MKKNILLVSDVKGWGGWKRAEMIKNYLSDEFNFDLMAADEFNVYNRQSSPNVFSIHEIESYIKSEKYGNDKEFLSVEQFRNWLNSHKNKKRYDVIYLLFHTMLIKKSVKRIINTNQKVMTMVTVYPTIRPGFVKLASGKGKGTYKEGQRLFLSSANKCSAILANNNKSLEDLKTIYKGQTFYAPRGVDPEVFYPTNKFVKKPENEFTVAFCGKPNPEKGLKSLITPACQQAGVKLITNERNFTNALTEDEMREFYNKADAYIVASTMDGTPNTALEAAACGKPIISNEIGNMPEFIERGYNGFLLPLEINKYINRIKWMVNNQKKTWEMGQEARKTILKSWTWEKVLENERKAFRYCCRI